MGRKRKELPFFEHVEIETAGAEGKAIGRVNGQVVFVKNAVPGDVVDVKVQKKRRRFFEGTATNFHTKSEKRSEPFCEHFGVCGGCKWQNMQYEYQLGYKQQQVEDNFKRIGHLEFPEVLPILPSKETKFYRNKMEYTFTNKRWLTEEEIGQDSVFERRTCGFHVPGRFDGVLQVNECHLQNDISNDVRNFIVKFAIENDISFFDLREQVGLLRTLIIRTTSTSETMVIICFHQNVGADVQKVLSAVELKFPEITSLLYVINGKRNDTISDLDVHCHKGQSFITEEMEGLKFKIGPKSFYQTNSEQAYNLYKITREFADISENDVVYDLYTGTGTIANFVAKKAKKVVGVEYVEDAIKDAKINSENNGISNTVFYAGDMKDVLTADFVAENGTPDVIITDPPRAGMHEDVVNQIKMMRAPKVVYVSCNPATQARDLDLLQDLYEIQKVQPVDMFPQTHHVENVVLLKLK